MNNRNTSSFGFWVYLMTDCVLFATLFAAYAVLHNSTNGGPNAAELFSLRYVLVETLLLLTSSFTIGLAALAIDTRKRRAALAWLVTTFILGTAFVAMEVHEFQHLIQEGNGPSRSAFLSSYFTLVGTHGLHILVGLIWMIVLAVIVLKRGLNDVNGRQLGLLSMFWHFLDVIWIFIFTVVYLIGVSR